MSLCPDKYVTLGLNSRLLSATIFPDCSICWFLGILSAGAGLEVAGTGLALGVFVTSQSVNLAGAIKLKFKTTHDTGSNERSTGSVVTLNKISHLATQHSLHTSLPAVCVCGSLGSALHISNYLRPESVRWCPV